VVTPHAEGGVELSYTDNDRQLLQACQLCERAVRRQVTARQWLKRPTKRPSTCLLCRLAWRQRRLICTWLLMMKRRRLQTCRMASCAQTSSQLRRRTGQTTSRVRRPVHPAEIKHRQSLSPSHCKASTSRWPAVTTTTTCTNSLTSCMHWTSSRLCRRRETSSNEPILVRAIGLHRSFRPYEWLNETGLYILKHSLVHNNSTCM